MSVVNYNFYALMRDQIKNSQNYLDIKTLTLKLAKKVDESLIRQTVAYIIKTNKIMISKDNKLIWIFADTPKSKKLLKECVKVA